MNLNGDLAKKPCPVAVLEHTNTSRTRGLHWVHASDVSRSPTIISGNLARPRAFRAVEEDRITGFIDGSFSVTL